MNKPFYITSLRTTIPFVLNFLISIPILTFIIISLIAYLLLGKQSTQSIVEQTHNRQLELAISGAKSITQLIDLVGTSLVSTANIISTSNSDPKPFVDSFNQSWENSPITSASILDSKGNILYINDTINIRDLPNFQNRDYFIWAQTASPGAVFVGQPVKPKFGTNQDKFFVSIATPLTKNGQFDGVFVTSMDLSKLPNYYLDNLKFTNSTRIYLIDSKGNMLYSPFPQLQGINYLEYLEQNKFPGSELIKNTLQKYAGTPEAGKFNAILPNAETKIPSSFMISRAPITFDSQHWILAIATPTNDAVAFVGPIYINQLGLLITSFLILIVLIVRKTKQVVYKELSPALR